MEILYVGPERNEAQAIATALGALDENVTVAWTSRLDHVVRWIDEHRENAALVVEANENGTAWRSVLKYAAGSRTVLPVALIVPPAATFELASLGFDAYEAIARNQWLLRDLPAAVTRAVDRARRRPSKQAAPTSSPRLPEGPENPIVAAATAPLPAGNRQPLPDLRQREETLAKLLDHERLARTDLERQLAQATANFHDAERRHLSAMELAAQQLARSQSQYEIGMARAAVTWDMVNEQLQEAAHEIERSRRNHAAAAADVDRLSHRESELAALLAAATTAQAALERRIVEAETALDTARARTAEERRAAAERLVERQRELQGQIDVEVDKRREVEDTLTHALNAREAAEKRHTSAMTAAAAKARDLEDALKLVKDDLAARAANLERLVVRETDLVARLAEVTSGRDDLAGRLAASEAAIQEADARVARERLAAARTAAEREAELEKQIEQERLARAALERAVAAATEALRDAQERHEVALAAASRELAERQAHFNQELSQATAECSRLTGQVRDIEGALDEMRREHQSAIADVGRLAQREVDLASELAEVQADRQLLGAQLTEAAGRIQAAAERETVLGAELRHERTMRATAEQSVADASATLEQLRREYEAAAAGVERLTEREAVLSAELASVEAVRHRIELQFADAVRAIGNGAAREAALEGELQQERAMRASVERAVTEANGALDQVRGEYQSAVAAVERLTSELADVRATREALEVELVAASRTMEDASRRQAAADEQLREDKATRATLEHALADLRGVLEDAQKEHSDALAAAARELSARQAHFDRASAEGEAQRDSLGAQLREVGTALDQARRAHQLAAADVERLTRREAELSTSAANCQAALETRLARATEKGDTLELTLAATSAAALETERKLREEANALRTRALEQAAHFEDEFARERCEQESRLTEVQETHRRLTVERDALLASLRTVQEEARRLEHEVRETRGRLEQTRADAELERQRLTTEREDIARRLDDERVQSRNVSDSLTREHAAALAVRDRENERLQHALAANTEELALTVRQRDVLRADAAELPRLRVQVDESRAENQRAFQQAPMAMFRCTKDGALIQVNRVCTVLVRRTHDELRNADFAASVFESPNDLSWLIENCLSTRRKESTETTWRRKDGSRLFVRVSAYATSSDVIECAVEDLTPVRVLQDRLSQAHRMEAVGRLAAEVAATCGNTLNGVHQNAQQWLMTTDGSSVSRQHGEMLLEEVSRAAASLRQLAAYGDAETRTPAMVDLKTVVRNLAPVLKRLAGNTVDLQLPGTSASLNVDVDAERVERLLVNIAAHGRERMPFGGRLRIELGTIVVDRHFTAKHPNVRLGPHALITITEIRNTPPADRPLRLRGEIAAPSPNAQGGAAGVDLGTLQSLVAECGGHLWMTVQPLGDMVVKVRLPLVTSYGQADPGSVASRGSRVRTLARWFQS